MQHVVQADGQAALIDHDVDAAVSGAESMPRQPDVARTVKRAICICVAIIAALPLVVGWGAGIDIAKRIIPGSAAIVPTTSLALLVVAGALYIDSRQNTARCGPACLISGILLIAMGGVSMVLRGAGISNGLSSFLMPTLIGNEGTAMATATAMVIAGYCLACLNIQTEIARRAYEAAATVGLVFSMVAIICYAFERNALLGVTFFTSMALTTATAFALTFGAFLLVRRQETWLRHITSSQHGARSARRLFPFIVLAPPLLCLGALKLIEDGRMDVGFAFSVLAVVFMAISVLALVRNASLENAEEMRRTIDDLRELNEDKQVLLAEVYHRVKNNLQQMSAMIQLERSKVKDPAERERLDKILFRIRSVGVVHQMLVGARTPSRVEVGSFLGELTAGLSSGYNLTQRNIRMEVEADDLTLPIDAAVPLGLLVNELVTNAIKHAFPEDQAGTITVRHLSVADGVELTVEDNGVGMATAGSDHGLGTMIIRGLVHQLRGNLTVGTDGGTTATVFFPGVTANGEPG